MKYLNRNKQNIKVKKVLNPHCVQKRCCTHIVQYMQTPYSFTAKLDLHVTNTLHNCNSKSHTDIMRLIMRVQILGE